MNTEIRLLSDVALDTVSGGRINLPVEGQPAIAGSIKADGSAGSVSSGNNNLLNDFLGCTLIAVGAAFGIMGHKSMQQPTT